MTDARKTRYERLCGDSLTDVEAIALQADRDAEAVRLRTGRRLIATTPAVLARYRRERGWEHATPRDAAYIYSFRKEVADHLHRVRNSA